MTGNSALSIPTDVFGGLQTIPSPTSKGKDAPISDFYPQHRASRPWSREGPVFCKVVSVGIANFPNYYAIRAPRGRNGKHPLKAAGLAA